MLPVRDAERFSKVFDILQANQSKDFVQRIIDPQKKLEAIINPDGSYSTHRMATAEAEGVHYVFPTVLRDDLGNLRDYGKEDSFREAIKRGEAIGFKTAKEADWFERNWKVVWGHKPRKRKNGKERRK
jgi:hypothetical protein